jgi:hypothetical protein
MRRPSNFVGRQFGRWSVISRAPNRSSITYWVCRCVCGTTREVQGNSLWKGESTSCGCHRRDQLHARAALLVGRRIGRLTITKIAGEDEVGHPLLYCHCDCGGAKKVPFHALRTRIVKSCGCLQAESRKVSSRKHGLVNTWVYSVYINMINRCYRENLPSYKNYGGRGITVCARWRFGENGKSGVECFYEDVGERPEGLTLDRKNNNGNYEPDNCRWATYQDQRRNRRDYLTKRELQQ